MILAVLPVAGSDQSIVKRVAHISPPTNPGCEKSSIVV
jgi:hypothetical protein